MVVSRGWAASRGAGGIVSAVLAPVLPPLPPIDGAAALVQPRVLGRQLRAGHDADARAARGPGPRGTHAWVEEAGRPAAAERIPPHVRRVADAAVAAGVVRRGGFAGELLERYTFGLGDQERGDRAAEHEEGKDLHQAVEPGRAGGAGLAVRRGVLDQEGRRDDLGHDGTDLAHGG